MNVITDRTRAEQYQTAKAAAAPSSSAAAPSSTAAASDSDSVSVASTDESSTIATSAVEIKTTEPTNAPQIRTTLEFYRQAVPVCDPHFVPPLPPRATPARGPTTSRAQPQYPAVPAGSHLRPIAALRDEFCPDGDFLSFMQEQKKLRNDEIIKLQLAFGISPRIARPPL